MPQAKQKKAVKTSAKNKKSPRRRRARKNVIASRTTQQVESALRRQKPLTIAHAGVGKYLHCRLDPWNSSSGMIPDGSATRRIMVDHRSYADVLAKDGGSFYFRTFPSLPFFGLMKTVNAGVFLNGSEIANITPDRDFNWVPTLCPAEYYAVSTNVNTFRVDSGYQTDTNNPFQASRFRIVTQAVRITYTGPASSASGLITARSAPLSVRGYGVTLPNTVNYTNWLSNVTGNYQTGSGRSVIITWDSTRGTATVDDFSCRPEMGISAIVKHNGDYDWMDYSAAPMAVVPSESAETVICTNGTGPSSQNAFQFGGVAGIDAAWDSVEFEFNNLNQNAAFRIESVLCVEYEIKPTSAFARMASKPPPEQRLAIRAVDSTLAAAPIAYASSKSGSLVNAAIKSAASLAPLVGAAFGPSGAAIGGAVDMFAQLTL